MTSPQSFKPTFDPPTPFEPLVTHFEGVLAKWSTEVRHSAAFNTDRQVVTFSFSGITVIESREPYIFPTLEVEVGFSQANDQPWSVLADSFRKAAPEGTATDLDAIVGKRQRWTYGTCMLSRRDQATGVWALKDAKAWQIESVEGWSAATGPSSDEVLIELADGKTDNQFMQAYYADNRVRSSADYAANTSLLAQGKLLSKLVEEGKLTQDAEGVYHKV